MSSARAPFSTREPKKEKQREFKELPIVGPSPVAPKIEPVEPIPTTRKVTPLNEKELPPVTLGEYHDPQNRYKKVEPKPLKNIAGASTPPQSPKVEILTEATVSAVTGHKKVELGRWASITQDDEDRGQSHDDGATLRALNDSNIATSWEKPQATQSRLVTNLDATRELTNVVTRLESTLNRLKGDKHVESKKAA